MTASSHPFGHRRYLRLETGVDHQVDCSSSVQADVLGHVRRVVKVQPLHQLVQLWRQRSLRRFLASGSGIVVVPELADLRGAHAIRQVELGEKRLQPCGADRTRGGSHGGLQPVPLACSGEVGGEHPSRQQLVDHVDDGMVQRCDRGRQDQPVDGGCNILFAVCAKTRVVNAIQKPLNRPDRFAAARAVFKQLWQRSL